MAYEDNHKGSAELEREVEAQRNRVESTIGEIKERLTPGQLIDEMLSYTKHGGAHFASNLGHQLSANPVPAALVGVGLAWLIMGGNKSASAPHHHHSYGAGRDWTGYRAYPEFGRATHTGFQRVSHARDDAGEWYSEFTDDAGKKYRARSNEQGHRAGHFMDDTGKQISGFVDEAGRRIDQFRDEAGNLLDEATGWASHTWQDAADAIARAGSDLGGQAAHLADQAGHAIHDVQTEAARMTRSAMQTLEQQPLIAAALAFAAGAALGAALPATKEEDALIGKTADDMKREAAHVASDLYEKGKEKVAEVYEESTEKAGEIYADAKRKVTGKTTQNGNIQPH